MIEKEELFIKEFHYQLPEEKIAKYPLQNRDESKLLVYRDGDIRESNYLHLDQYLPANAFLIFNNTKVVEVRLLFTKETGGIIELFCLEPAGDYPDITTAMMEKGSVTWKCLVGGIKKWKHENLSAKREHNGKELILSARKGERLTDSFLIEFTWNDDALTFAEILHLFGKVPLPPYLNRHAEEEDKNRYQTIYAKWDGSVAAPTAGLHFTDRVFDKLEKKGIEKEFVTLHVGAGTFKPVKTESVAEHEMHSEFIEVPLAVIQNIKAHLFQNIIAVGTTSLRTLESLYWLGVKVLENEEIGEDDLFLSQWEVYDLPQAISPEESLQALLNWMTAHNLAKLITKTQIIIVPGYQLRIANAIVTNFHQPQSTLLLLIAAFVGDDWKRIYHYALENDFRFLSYGDGSLLWKK